MIDMPTRRLAARRLELASLLLCGLLLAALPGACTKNAPPPKTPDAAEVRFTGRATCAKCHPEEAKFCDYGAHRRLQCERCHGAGSRHAEADAAARPALALGDVDLCLSCHRSGPDGDPATKSRIESLEAHLSMLEQEHRVDLDRARSETDCVFCHDPHLLE